MHAILTRPGNKGKYLEVQRNAWQGMSYLYETCEMAHFWWIWYHLL